MKMKWLDADRRKAAAAEAQYTVVVTQPKKQVLKMYN